MKNTHLMMTLSSVLVMIIIVLAITTVCISNKLKAESMTLEILSVNSISFEQINKNNESRISSYIKHNYKKIPSPTTNLIAINIVKFAKELHVPVSVIVGIIEVESAFDPCQVSSARARGLMQVRWCVWKEKLKEKGINNEYDLHEIDSGIFAGITVLKHYISEGGDDLPKALYNYVGKSESYIMKVYKAMGRFILYEC